VRPGWLSDALEGEYDVRDKQGKTCLLTIQFVSGTGQESEEFGLSFRYGSESQGPPDDICEFVAAAVQLTDGWRERQGFIVSSGNRVNRPWWKIW
jgi:hypothetical protein